MRIRYGLRSALIAMALIASVLGWLRYIGIRGRRQHQAVTAIQATSSIALYDYQFDDNGRFITGFGPELPDTLLSRVAGPHAFRSVRKLTLGSSFDDEDARHLASLYSLEELDLANLSITDKAMDYVRQLRRLRNLSLANTQVTDNGLRKLNTCSNLRQLDLSGTDVTDEGLAILSSLDHLDSLALDGTRVTSRGLVHLHHCRDLRELRINGTQVTDEGIASLQSLTRLKSLDLLGTNVTTSGLSKLKELKLDDLRFEWRPDGLSALTHFFCDLQGRPLDDALLASGLAEGRGGLDRLFLRDMQVSDEDVAALTRFGSLATLYLDENPITDACIQDLAKLRNLRLLSIIETHTTSPCCLSSFRVQKLTSTIDMLYWIRER